MLFDDLKAYIEKCIQSDSEILDTVGIKEQYVYGVKPNPPEILLQFMDNKELQSATDFEGETTSYILLQIVAMTSIMTIGDKKYNAQKACNIITDKICEWFSKEKVKKAIPNIINTTRVQFNSAFPYESGTAVYYGILRFELTVTKNTKE